MAGNGNSSRPPVRRKLTQKQAAQLVRKQILGWFSLIAIAVVLLVVVISAGSVISQMNGVKDIAVVSDEYAQISALPTLEEQERQKRLEELRRIDEIFSERESYPIEMDIRTPYCVMYDVQAQELLYAKNANEKAFPASTTKVMTAAVMMEYAPQDTVFTPGAEQSMLSEGSSLANIEEGMELSRSNILDAIMIPSGNDASYCAAAVTGRIIAGDDKLSANAAVNTFVDKMNETAEMIGCKNTHFTCPDGFHDDDHYTTAMDLLKITVYSRRFPEIAEAGAKNSAEDEFLTGETAEWSNSNRLIDESSDYYYTYADGLKTGMTDVSGFCMIATARRFEHDLILVCLGSETSDIRYNDTIALFDQGFVYVRNRAENETSGEDEDSAEDDGEEYEYE